MISSPPSGAVPTSSILRTRDGRARAISCATMPPRENPSKSTRSSPSASRKASACAAIPSTASGTLPVERPMPALSNRMTSRPHARASVTAGSQLSSVPVKCCRKTRGCEAPPPKRRYAYVSFCTSFCTWRNCVAAVMLLGTAIKVDMLIYLLSARRSALSWTDLLRDVIARAIFLLACSYF